MIFTTWWSKHLIQNCFTIITQDGLKGDRITAHDIGGTFICGGDWSLHPATFKNSLLHLKGPDIKQMAQPHILSSLNVCCAASYLVVSAYSLKCLYFVVKKFPFSQKKFLGAPPQEIQENATMSTDNKCILCCHYTQEHVIPHTTMQITTPLSGKPLDQFEYSTSDEKVGL